MLTGRRAPGPVIREVIAGGTVSDKFDSACTRDALQLSIQFVFTKVTTTWPIRGVVRILQFIRVDALPAQAEVESKFRCYAPGVLTVKEPAFLAFGRVKASADETIEAGDDQSGLQGLILQAM